MTDTAAQTLPDTAGELRSLPFPWWTVLLTGLCAVALGLAVLIWPDLSLRIMAALTGVWLLLSGLVRIIVAFLPTGGGVGRHLLSGVVGLLSLVAGLFCVRNLVTGLAVLAVVFAATWILSGLALVPAAVAAHGAQRAVLVVVVVISIAAGTVFVITPTLSLGALVLMTGIGSLVVGLAEVVLAFYLRGVRQ
ncbi:HdeD family acid-resistance protein [Actinoplanes sandaracinus]|uniref:HdeD family acid-resistance protein n=1 Tax=Actinoplanes sandaracinus TaxID=3045177 RepID=UPI00389915EE